MSYCSETLKEIFLELPLPAGGMFAVLVVTGAFGRRSGCYVSCCSVLRGIGAYAVEFKCQLRGVPVSRDSRRREGGQCRGKRYVS